MENPVILLTSLHYLYLASRLPFLATVLTSKSYNYQDLGNTSISVTLCRISAYALTLLTRKFPCCLFVRSSGTSELQDSIRAGYPASGPCAEILG